MGGGWQGGAAEAPRPAGGSWEGVDREQEQGSRHSLQLLSTAGVPCPVWDTQRDLAENRCWKWDLPATTAVPGQLQNPLQLEQGRSDPADFSMPVSARERSSSDRLVHPLGEVPLLPPIPEGSASLLSPLGFPCSSQSCPFSQVTVKQDTLPLTQGHSLLCGIFDNVFL